MLLTLMEQNLTPYADSLLAQARIVLWIELACCRNPGNRYNLLELAPLSTILVLVEGLI